MKKYIVETQKIWEIQEEDPQSIINLANKYLQWLEISNYSKSTIKGYRYQLGRFIFWFRECSHRKITDATKDIIRRYKVNISQYRNKQDKPLSHATQNSLLSCIYGFFTWAQKKEYIATNPAENIEYYRLTKRVPRYVLNPEQVEKILQQPDITTQKGIRDRAFMELFYSSGIRRTELLRLTVRDVDLNKGFVLIVEGKGLKDRLVPIGDRAIKWLEKYLRDVRSKIVKKTTEERLFLTTHGYAIRSANLFTTNVREYAAAAKIKTGNSCHLFRHAMATAMLENGADIRYIKECLGHSELATTEIYTRVAITGLKNIHEKTHPANSEKNTVFCENKEQKRSLPITKKRKEPKLHHFWFKEFANNSLPFLALKFLEDMKLAGYKPSYISSTRFYLRKFLEWCYDREIHYPQSVDKKVFSLFESYIYYHKKKINGEPLSVISRRQQVIAVGLLLCWLTKKKYMTTNPAKDMQIPKVAQRIPRNVLSPEEIEEILALPDTTTTIGIRDRAMFEMFYSTGIRRTELANLMIEDVDFIRQTVLVRNAKGHKDRIVPIGKRALDWLEQYLLQSRDLLCRKEDEQILFISGHGNQFRPDSISEIIMKYLKAAGLHKHGIACHLFRHACATHMLSAGADIRYIKEILGHKKLSATEIYTRVSIDKLKEIHTNTHPAKMQSTKPKQVAKELDPDIEL